MHWPKGSPTKHRVVNYDLKGVASSLSFDLTDKDAEPHQRGPARRRDPSGLGRSPYTTHRWERVRRLGTW